MRLIAVLALLLTPVLRSEPAGAASASTPPFSQEELPRLFERLTTPTDDSSVGGIARRTIRLSDDLLLEAELEGTTKGNGTISILNLLVRIHDQHDDGTTYDSQVLRLDLEDLDRDGVFELIFTGVLEHRDEDSGETERVSPLVYVFTLDRERNRFEPLFELGEPTPVLAR